MDSDAFVRSERQAVNENRQLEYVLVNNVVVSDENLGKVVANYLNLPLVNLSMVTIPEDILKIIPEVVARSQSVIAFKSDSARIHLAMSDPGNIQIRDFIEKKLGKPVVVHFALPPYKVKAVD